jgi:hypothetical protein
VGGGETGLEVAVGIHEGVRGGGRSGPAATTTRRRRYYGQLTINAKAVSFSVAPS